MKSPDMLHRNTAFFCSATGSGYKRMAAGQVMAEQRSGPYGLPRLKTRTPDNATDGQILSPDTNLVLGGENFA